jgi:ABC-type glycerol-3-phosphate transport system substrate-binding protein
MPEIEISYTAGDHEPTFISLVEEFSRQSGIKVRARRLAWETAWVELFTMASEGKGSDVSSIGSTWVSTLAKLDALRPFKPDELAEMGAENTFIKPSWENTKLTGDQRVWSIPWIGWMYVIVYRKDFLESAGIDPSKAFRTPQSTRDTLDALNASALEIPWLNADYQHPFLDYIHTAASWVWAAGG